MFSAGTNQQKSRGISLSLKGAGLEMSPCVVIQRGMKGEMAGSPLLGNCSQKRKQIVASTERLNPTD